MITLVTNDEGDWIGLYKDDELVEEGHSFEASRVLQLAGINHTRISDVDLEPLGSRLPRSLSDVPHTTATLMAGLP